MKTKNLNSIYISLISLIFFSSSQPSIQDKILFTEFPTSENVVLNNLFSVDLASVSDIHVTDSTILLKNYFGSSDFFYYEFLLSSKELVQRYIKGGRGKGEAFGGLSSGVYKDKLWMFDVSARKVIFTRLGDRSTEEYKLPHFYYNIQPISGLKVIGNGAFHSNYKIQEIDLTTGTEDMEFGVYNNVPADIPIGAWKRGHESLLYVRPNEQSAVAACRFSDQIEIIDLKTKTSKVISGPENFKAEFVPFKNQGGEDVIQRTDKTRLSFINASVTDKYIYLLYSGKNDNEHKPFYGGFIYIYDWSGNPVKKLTLGKSVLCIGVSQDDKVLYSFDEASQSVVFATIN